MSNYIYSTLCLEGFGKVLMPNLTRPPQQRRWQRIQTINSVLYANSLTWGRLGIVVPPTIVWIRCKRCRRHGVPVRWSSFSQKRTLVVGENN